MINVSKVDNWWVCQQCKKSFEADSIAPAYSLGTYGYYCEECLKSGIIWAIAMAHKEKEFQDER